MAAGGGRRADVPSGHRAHFLLRSHRQEPAGAGLRQVANGGEDAARVIGRGQSADLGLRAVDFSVLGARSAGDSGPALLGLLWAVQRIFTKKFRPPESCQPAEPEPCQR